MTSEEASHKEGLQVFSTEFITAMRVDDNVQLEDFRVVTDTWKQRYNDPIQVLSGSNKLKLAEQAGDIEHVEPQYSRVPFARPRTYVRSAHSKARTGTGMYDLDTEDEIWRQLYNSREPCVQPISLQHMEHIIFALEKQAFEGLDKAGDTAFQGLEYDENTVCDVCYMPDSEEGNEMVFCDGCNLCVHQLCYGIDIIPEGNWYCCACSSGSVRVSCALCSQRGGALKPCTDGKSYAHVRCASWIPECSFTDTTKMEPIDFSLVPLDRKRLVCVECGKRKGACIQCDVPKCVTAFHVSCATKAKYRMELQIDGDHVYRVAYCEKHRGAPCRHRHARILQPTFTAPEITTARVNAIQNEFCTFANVQQVAEEADVPVDIVRAIFSFWVQKRRRQHGKPLMRQFLPTVASQSSVYGNAETVKKQLHVTRQSLERARSLCEMARRREAKKRQLIEMMMMEFASCVNCLVPQTVILADFISSPVAEWLARPTAPSQPANPQEDAVSPETVRKTATKIIEALQSHPRSYPFKFPVDGEMYPDYVQLIKQPMDLATLHGRVTSGMYASYRGFIKDTLLIFTNCYEYNTPGSDITKACNALQDIFYAWVERTCPEHVEMLSKAVHTFTLDAPQPTSSTALADAPSASKSKAKTKKTKAAPRGTPRQRRRSSSGSTSSSNSSSSSSRTKASATMSAGRKKSALLASSSSSSKKKGMRNQSITSYLRIIPPTPPSFHRSTTASPLSSPSPSSPQRYSCPFCDKEFMHKSSLLRHETSHASRQKRK